MREICKKFTCALRFFKTGAVVAVLLLSVIPENAWGIEVLTSKGDVVIVPITGGNCVRLREFQPDVTVDAIACNSPSNCNLSIRINWGDGTIETFSGNQLNNLSFTSDNSAKTTRIFYAGATSGLRHNYPKASKFCMYQVSVEYIFGTTRIPDNKIYKVTVWSTDGDPDGMGEMSLVEQNTGERIYPVCKGSPFNVTFLNNSLLACNMEVDMAANGLSGDWKYDPRNNRTRWCQFIYYPTAGSPGGGIQDVMVGGVSRTFPYAAPVFTWNQYLSEADTHWNRLTEAMSLDINNAPVGARFTIEMRLWNACNPYTTAGSVADVYYAYIEIVDAPPSITPQSLTFCHWAHNNNTAYDYSMNLNYDPGTQFKPGIYRYYYEDRVFGATPPTGPSAASLSNPILIVPNQPTNPNLPPNTTNAAQSLNPYTANFNPTTYRLQPGSAGIYRYWVTYEFLGKMGSSADYVCPTKPTLLTWTVRENIRPAITTINGPKAVCSGTKITLSLPVADYPDSYTYGGNVQYIWYTPASTAANAANNQLSAGSNLLLVSGSTGVTATVVSISANGREIELDVDPLWRQVSGSNATLRLRVARQWATPPTCPSIMSGDIDITVYPLPTATLSGVTVDVCDGTNPTLRVSNVAGNGTVTNFSFTLNDGSSYSNQTFSNKTSTLDLGPTARAIKPVAAPAVTEYFIHTISYSPVTGLTCTSTNNYDNQPLAAGTGNTTPQVVPFGDGGAGNPSGNTAPVRVVWRANMNSGAYNPPSSITPATVLHTTPAGAPIALLCSGSSQTFDAGTAPEAINHPGKEASTGTGVPLTLRTGKDISKSFNTQYQWSWATAATTNPTYTTGTTANYPVTNIGTTTSAAGVPYILRLYREYTDGKCEKTLTREWDYILIPNPTATINQKNIQLCENTPSSSTVTVDINTGGYQYGNWTVDYKLTGTGMTDYTGSANIAQGTPAGTGTGTISIPFSAFTGTPKYGDYTVTLTSVTQNTTPASDCTGTVSGSQPIKLMKTPTADFVSQNVVICEKENYFVDPSWIVLDGEMGVNYSITYKTFDNGNNELCNPGPLNPDAGFTVSVSCMDQTALSNITTLRMYSVTQSHNATLTCTGTVGSNEIKIEVDKYPDEAVIDKTNRNICDKTINLIANTTANPNKWYVTNFMDSKPSGATAVTDYGFTPPSHYAELNNVTSYPIEFGIVDHGNTTSKYGRYILAYEISSSSPHGKCPASMDTILVNLATHALPAHISTEPQIVCDMSVILQTPDHSLSTGNYPLGAWETGRWSIDPDLTSKPSSSANSTASIITPSPGSGIYENDRRMTVNEPGTYLFRWTREVPGPCISQFDTVSITFGSIPVVEWDGLKNPYINPTDDPYYCPDEPINITFKETSGKSFPKYADQAKQNQEISYRWRPNITIAPYTGGMLQSTDNITTNAPANNSNVYAHYPIEEIRAVNTVTVTRANYAVKERQCLSTPLKNFDIIVKPKPKIHNLGNINVCPEDKIIYNLDPSLVSSNETNTRWSWTNTSAVQTDGLDGPASVYGTLATYIPKQPTTPHPTNPSWLIAEANDIEIQATVEGCPSDIEKFTITVNPAPVPSIAGRIPQPVCPLTDDVLFFNNVVDSATLKYTWSYIGGNTTLGSSGATSQEIYHLKYNSIDNLSANTTTSTISITAFGNVMSDVRSPKSVCSATSPTYTITVNPRPDMDALSTLQACGLGSGETYFPDVLFSISNRGTGNRMVSYSWVNNKNHSIAGADDTETVLSETTHTYNGSGDQAGIRKILIPENNGDTLMIAQITVTPSMGGCAGPAKNVDLKVLPRPLVTFIPNDTVCAGTAFNTIYPTVSNTDISRINFTMTPSSPASVSMDPASGQVNVQAYPVRFTSSTNNTGNYLRTLVTVRATGLDIPTGAAEGCRGPDSTFLLVVRPTPVINLPNNNLTPTTHIEQLCPGETFAPVAFNSNIATKPNAVLYRWSVVQGTDMQTNNIGSGMNGQVTGNGNNMVAFDGIHNISGRILTSTIQVTAELDGCVGEPIRFLQRLKPTPQMVKPADKTVCPMDIVPVVGISHNVVGQTTDGILWEVNSDIVEYTPASILPPGIGGGANRQSGNVPSFMANKNSTTTPATIEAIFTVTAQVDGCDSDTATYKVIVNPSPDIQRPAFLQGKDTLFVCHNEIFENGIIFTIPSFAGGGAYIEWWRTNVNIGETSPGVQLSTGSETSWITGSVPRFTTVNTTINAAESSERTSRFVVRSKTSSTVGCPSLPDTFAITVGAVPKIGVVNMKMCVEDEITTDKFRLIVDPSVKYLPTDTIYHWAVTNVRQNPTDPYNPGWFAELGLPYLNDPQTGSVGKFYPDTTYFAGNTLWGTQENIITISAYVELKKSDLTGLGCRSTAQDMFITINPLPITKIDIPTNNCIKDGQITVYYIEEPTRIPDFSTYYWTDGIDEDSSFAGRGPVKVQPNTTNLQNYQFPPIATNWKGYIEVVEKNFYGCFGPPARLHLSVVAAPSISAGPDRMLCEGDTIHLHAKILNFDASASYRYEWTPEYQFDQGTDYNTSDIIARPKYTDRIRLRVFNGPSCFGDDAFMLPTVISKPSAPILYDQVYCDSHLQMPISASYIGSSNTPNNILDPGYSLYWFRSVPVSAGVYDTIRITTANDSISISPSLRTGSPPTLVHPAALPSYPFNWSATTSQDTIIYYQVMQTNTQTNSVGTFTCRSDLSFPGKLTIRKSPTAPIGKDFTFCEDQMRPRYNIFVIPSDGSYVVNWYNQNGVSVGGSNGELWVTPVDLGLGGSSPVDTPETSTSAATYKPFKYYAEAFSGSGCPSPRTEVNLTIFPNPVLNPIMTDKDKMPTDGGCSPFLVNAFNNSPSNFADYQWSWDAHPDSVNLAPRGGYMPHTYYTTGSIPELRRIVLTGVSTVNRNSEETDLTKGFCSSEEVKYLTITPGVTANFFADIHEGCDPLQVIFTSTSHGAYKFRWYWDWKDPLEPPYPNSKTNPGSVIEPNVDDPNHPYYGIPIASPWYSFENKNLTTDRKYHVWLQVDNGACFDQKDTIITVYPVPNVRFSHNLSGRNNSICPPDSVMFTNESTGLTNNNIPGGTRYIWNYGDGTPVTTDYKNEQWHLFQSLNASAPIPTNITLTAQNQFTKPDGNPITCSSSSFQTIYVNPQVKADFRRDSVGCSPMTVVFYSQSIGAASTFVWDFDDPDDPNQGSGPNPRHTFVNDKTHDAIKTFNVKLTASNDYDCRDVITKPLVLYPEPIASFTPYPVSGCQPLEVTFYNTSNSTGVPNPATGTTYRYDFNDADTSGDLDNDQPFKHTYINMLGSNDLKQPTLTVTNQWGCVKTTPSQTITIFPYVRADFWMEDSVGCSPKSITFRNTSQGYSSFLYDWGDGSVEPGTNTSTSIETKHTFVNPSMYRDTVYYVTLTVTAGISQCTKTVTQKVLVRSQPVADFLPGPPYPSPYYYNNVPPLITLDNRIPLPDRDYLRYEWSYAERDAISAPPPPFYYDAYPSTLTIPNKWGVFDVKMFVAAPNNICKDSLIRTITIIPPTVIPGFKDVAPVCLLEPTSFINESQWATIYDWNFGDGLTSSAKDPVHYYKDAGTYLVTLTAIGETMEMKTITKPVVIHPQPIAGFFIQPNFLWVGLPLRATSTTSHRYSNGTEYDIWYKWDWGDNTDIDTDIQPAHTYLKKGSFTISLTVGTYTEPQCISSFVLDNAVEVEQAGDIIMPNVFKPDPTGPRDEHVPTVGYLNYLFYPPVLTPVRKYHFMVYSRTGQLLFETTEQDRGWNGYFRGQLCEEGVYVFVIEGVFETGQSFKKMGDITLLR